MSGQLRGGQFVRVEAIAAELGVSATPVREGLLALHGEGIVEVVPRHGFQVATLTRQDIRDLFWVQAQLEGELTARAAGHLSRAHLATLEHLQANMAQALTDGALESVERLNRGFHKMLSEAAHAPKLSWFLAQSVRYAPSRFYGHIGGWAQSSVEDHGPILEALRRGDAEGARTAMHQHILKAGELLSHGVGD